MPNLTIVLTSSSQVVNLTGLFPATSLRLHHVAVNYSTGNTNNQTAIAIEADLLHHNNTHNNQGVSMLIVPLKLGKQTALTYTDFVINQVEIPQAFTINLYQVDCQTQFSFTNVTNVILSFSFEQTTLY